MTSPRALASILLALLALVGCKTVTGASAVQAGSSSAAKNELRLGAAPLTGTVPATGMTLTLTPPDAGNYVIFNDAGDSLYFQVSNFTGYTLDVQEGQRVRFKLPAIDLSLTVYGPPDPKRGRMPAPYALRITKVPPPKPSNIPVRDYAALTLPPPDDHTQDNGVTISPYTPPHAVSPLAAKTVFEAMEAVRDTFHVDVPDGVTKTNLNKVRGEDVEGCLGNIAAHWSDLMIHYYCQHGAARGCYSPRAPKGREKAYEDCKSDPAFAWIVNNQPDVFRYVMFSQTFAFDMQQQQDVINKFYGVENPGDVTECNDKRPLRAIDPSDGTHCLANKKFSTPLSGVGR